MPGNSHVLFEALLARTVSICEDGLRGFSVFGSEPVGKAACDLAQCNQTHVEL